MKISDLKAGQGKVDVELKVKSKAEPRVMQKYGKELKVANAVVMDDSGEITLTLWNDDVDAVNAGDTIKITNGYVSEFNGQKQLTSGKFGKLEVVSGSGGASAAGSAKKEKKEAEKKKADDDDDIEELEF